MTRACLKSAVLLLACVSLALAHDGKPDLPPKKSSVGMPVRVDQIVLPGGELEARPVESRKVPIVLRVVATYPHGSAFRYDLEYHGLEPGSYDLGDYLQRKDGSPLDGLPKLPVEIVSLLPAGQILPADPGARPAPRLGGYRLWLLLGMLAWFGGLIAILFARRRAQLAQQRAVERPLSLAERLQPLVTAAMNGQLTPQGTAEIERLLLSYWRHRLQLDEEDPRVAVTALREHDEAGALLRQVEAWLHKPGAAQEVDIAALLAPYRDLPSETLPPRSASAPPQAAGAGGRS